MQYYREQHVHWLPNHGEFRWTSYYEFEGSRVKRQIDVHPDTVLLLQGGEVCEASLEEMGFQPSDHVQPEEFLSMWEQYSKTPHGTLRIHSPYLQAGVPSFRKMVEGQRGSDHS